ncbi:MAG: GNAT family N-acetyltransferase [Gemmatimonadota bacterium]
MSELVSLTPKVWDERLLESGRPFRFSHRAEGVGALASTFSPHPPHLLEVRFQDGARFLIPTVKQVRAMEALSIHVALPLDWEGMPIPLDGELQAAHLHGLLQALGGGGLRVHGGGRNSPPSTGTVRTHTTHILDLTPGFQELWASRFSGKNRNSCRKAEKSGVTVERRVGPEAFQAYVHLYRNTQVTRQEGDGYPDALFSALAPSPFTEVWFAQQGGEVVAGAVFLQGSEDVFYWSGAMDREHQGAAPSNAVLKAAIHHFSEAGVRYLDMGASEGLPGVRRFKESFGAEPAEVRSVEITTRLNRGLSRVAGLREWVRGRLRRGPRQVEMSADGAFEGASEGTPG